MIVDPSALLAILKFENEGPAFRDKLRDTLEPTLMSTGSWLEAGIVVDRENDAQLSNEFDALIADFGISIVPFTPSQATIARAAYRQYGKGSGHPAQLNFGDCFAYALAKESGEPLLFKGNDFSQTDIAPALP